MHDGAVSAARHPGQYPLLKSFAGQEPKAREEGESAAKPAGAVCHPPPGVGSGPLRHVAPPPQRLPADGGARRGSAPLPAPGRPCALLAAGPLPAGRPPGEGEAAAGLCPPPEGVSRPRRGSLAGTNRRPAPAPFCICRPAPPGAERSPAGMYGGQQQQLQPLTLPPHLHHQQQQQQHHYYRRQQHYSTLPAGRRPPSCPEPPLPRPLPCREPEPLPRPRPLPCRDPPPCPEPPPPPPPLCRDPPPCPEPPRPPPCFEPAAHHQQESSVAYDRVRTYGPGCRRVSTSCSSRAASPLECSHGYQQVISGCEPPQQVRRPPPGLLPGPRPLSRLRARPAPRLFALPPALRRRRRQRPPRVQRRRRAVSQTPWGRRARRGGEAAGLGGEEGRGGEGGGRRAPGRGLPRGEPGRALRRPPRDFEEVGLPHAERRDASVRPTALKNTQPFHRTPVLGG